MKKCNSQTFDTVENDLFFMLVILELFDVFPCW